MVKRTIAPPTATIVNVCPTPHKLPIRRAARIVGWRVYGQRHLPIEQRYIKDATGNPIIGQHEPILDVETWQAVIAVLNSRSQQGNNNGYCQDNELSWVSWSEIDQPLLEYVRWLISFRRHHPVFRRRRWFQGRPIRGAVDIAWFKPDGKPMTDRDWVSRHARSLGVYLNGKAIPGHDDRGRSFADDSFLLLFNGHSRTVYWQMPPDFGGSWKIALDTDALQPQEDPQPITGRVMTRARTVVILQSRGDDASTEPG